jgi:ElaB/YqjD/DUF883 family membrane-anchored ribosome-binding protein
MIGMRRSRRQEAERIAGQAWDNLVSVVDSAGESARSAKRRAAHVVDDASSRVSSTTHEARRRANAAFDALAGRRPPKPWGWLLGAAAAGAVLGWLTNMMARQAARRDDLDTTETLGLTEEPLVEHTPNRSHVAGQRAATTM